MDENYDYYDDYYPEEEERAPDPAQERAREKVIDYFEERKDSVFFSRQIEIHFEKEFFHWITNRALRELIEEGILKSEMKDLSTGGKIKTIWHKNYRYYKRAANRIINIVEEYSNPEITRSIGHHGETMVMEGFVRKGFVMKGSRGVNEYNGKKWTETEHNIDFIFEKESMVYGVEVKNKLGYMEYDEFKTKIRLCKYIGVKPVFVVRMNPEQWTYELWKEKGFSLILKYQLYPLALKQLAERVRKELNLPVDTPKYLEDGTMQRFIRWHNKNL